MNVKDEVVMKVKTKVKAGRHRDKED